MRARLEEPQLLSKKDKFIRFSSCFLDLCYLVEMMLVWLWQPGLAPSWYNNRRAFYSWRPVLKRSERRESMKLLNSWMKERKNAIRDSLVRWMSRQGFWKWRKLTMPILMVCQILIISQVPLIWLSFVSIVCRMKHLEVLWKQKNTQETSRWPEILITFSRFMSTAKDR